MIWHVWKHLDPLVIHTLRNIWFIVFQYGLNNTLSIIFPKYDELFSDMSQHVETPVLRGLLVCYSCTLGAVEMHLITDHPWYSVTLEHASTIFRVLFWGLSSACGREVVKLYFLRQKINTNHATIHRENVSQLWMIHIVVWLLEIPCS